MNLWITFKRQLTYRYHMLVVGQTVAVAVNANYVSHHNPSSFDVFILNIAVQLLDYLNNVINLAMRYWNVCLEALL